MSEILFHYHRVHPATWVYLSSLLMIGLFFKFNRFWSVRNVDLLLLILLSPGLLLVHFGEQNLQQAQAEFVHAGLKPPDPAVVSDEISSALAGTALGPAATATSPAASSAAGDARRSAAVQPGLDEMLASETGQRFAQAVRIVRRGYVWLFAVGGLLLVRLLLDPTMVRRPLLEPNLSTSGLAFIGISLFVFLMANVLTNTPTPEDLQGPRRATELLRGVDAQDNGQSLRRHGPGYALLNAFPSIPTIALGSPVPGPASPLAAVAKAMAIISHLAIVLGIVGIGYFHFNNLQTGIGVATMYLMLPYTAVMTGKIDHVLPAALLVWAVLAYRRPLAAGIFIGLAVGVVYYPLFLLPLWISFYWRRGLGRFTLGVVSMLALMVLLLVFTSDDWSSFTHKVVVMFGIWIPRMAGLEGIWGLGWDASYRIPVLALFATLSLTLALWPAQKNLGTLMSCSAAVMVATQFWHGYGGGLFMAWYLPLTLLTIFRPNLEDRVALTVLGQGWFAGRRGSGSLAA